MFAETVLGRLLGFSQPSLTPSQYLLLLNVAFREEDLRSGVSLDGHWAWVPLTVPVSGHIGRAKGTETGGVQLPTK